MLRRIYDILFYIFTKEQPSISSSASLEEEWVIILSEYETKITETQQNQVKDELEAIKARTTKLTYKDLIKDVQSIAIDYQEQIENVKEYSLLTDLKAGLFKDVFSKLSETWLGYLTEICPGINKEWYPTKYERNVLGELVAIANQFCPNKLNIRGLCQTIMSVHLSLSQTLNTLRKEPLLHEESKSLLSMLVQTTVRPIIESWLDTIKRSRSSSSRLGNLPSKWQEEENQLKDKLEKIKLEGKIDAKFDEGELDPIRRKYLKERFGVSTELICKEENDESVVSINNKFQAAKRMLEANLHFRKTTPIIIPSERSFNFNDVRQLLEKTLRL